jgi:hypothetical protein
MSWWVDYKEVRQLIKVKPTDLYRSLSNNRVRLSNKNDSLSSTRNRLMSNNAKLNHNNIRLSSNANKYRDRIIKGRRSNNRSVRESVYQINLSNNNLRLFRETHQRRLKMPFQPHRYLNSNHLKSIRMTKRTQLRNILMLIPTLLPLKRSS